MRQKSILTARTAIPVAADPPPQYRSSPFASAAHALRIERLALR
jgi:hypothetical protein